jgi:hypothetical protein
MGEPGYVTHTGVIRNAKTILIGEHERKIHFEGLGVHKSGGKRGSRSG